jgi:SSS family solute:Na+ symporter
MVQATVAIATILAYTAVVLALGYHGWRVGKLEVGDWVAADRGLGVVVLLFTYAATYHSAFAFLGAAGFTYAHGIGFFLAGFLWLVISGVIVYVLGTKLWLVGKRYGYVTPSEVLADFYDSEALGLLVSAVMILFTFPYVAVQLIGSGIIFETATDGLVSFELGALFLLVVGVIYVWLGGMRSIAWTDTVQGVFMIAAMWIAGWLFVFTAYRGPRDFWTDLAAEAPAHLALPGPADLLAWEFYLSFAVVIGIGVALAPHIVLRYYSAASPRTLKWVAAGGTAYLVLFYVPLVFLALGAVVALPELANPDQAVPEVLFAFTPVWFASVVIAGAIAAAMATKDSQLHAVSTLIVRDWYEPYVESDPDERRRTRLLQVLVLVLASISYVVAIQELDIIVQVTLVAFDGIAQVLPALVGAFYWRRASASGAIVGLLAGVAVAAVLAFEVVVLPDAMPAFQAGFYGLLVNATLFVAVSLLADPVPVENREKIQGYVRYAARKGWEAGESPPAAADD